MTNQDATHFQSRPSTGFHRSSSQACRKMAVRQPKFFCNGFLVTVYFVVKFCYRCKVYFAYLIGLSVTTEAADDDVLIMFQSRMGGGGDDCFFSVANNNFPPMDTLRGEETHGRGRKVGSIP